MRHTQNPPPWGWVALQIRVRLRHFALDVDPVIENSDGAAVPLSRLVEALGRETAKSLPGVRATLQGVGRAIRAQWPGLLIDQLRADIIAHGNGPVVVTDVRMPAEVDTVLALGGKVVRVVRSASARFGVTNAQDITEIALAAYDLPQIDNNGTLGDLELAVDKFLISDALPGPRSPRA